MDTEFEWLSPDEGETVVWRGRPRLRRILPTVATSAAWMLVFVAVAVVGPRYAPPPVPGVAVAGGALLLAALSAWPAFRAYLRTRNVHYVLTDRNVYRKRGVLSTNVTRVGVGNVQNTRLKKDVLGTLFDYGSVAISTAGSGGADLTVTDLDDPDELRDELRRVTGQHRSRVEPTASAPARGALDAGTADALLADARAMREAAERLAWRVTDG